MYLISFCYKQDNADLVIPCKTSTSKDQFDSIFHLLVVYLTVVTPSCSRQQLFCKYFSKHTGKTSRMACFFSKVAEFELSHVENSDMMGICTESLIN